MKILAAHFKALRPRQWTKNLVVFAGPVFNFDLSLAVLAQMLLALGLFCAASSSFYLINDIVDVESDRQHPVKCQRPIASGLVEIPTAIAMSAVLLAGAVGIGWWHAPALGITLMTYLLVQVAYNLRLKHAVLLDVMAIAAGFVLRALAGAAATDIVLSPWFMLCTAFLALFLGIEKRKAELRLSKLRSLKTRAVLQRYSLTLLNRMETIVTSGTIVTYALWSSGPQVQGATTPWMMLTLPFVLYGVFRYQLLSDPQESERRQLQKGGEIGERSERPEEVLLTDRPILLTILSWLATTVAIMWLQTQGVIR